MNYDRTTVAVFTTALLLVIVYDIWTLAKRGHSTTISFNLLYFAKRYPIIAFAFGVVVGHLWWPHADCAQ